MKIESYEFGKMVVGGQTYRSDVIVYPDSVQRDWWRKEGHRLDIEDLKEVIEADPEVVIVGTGCYGRLIVPGELIEEISRQEIELLAFETSAAIESYNNIAVGKKTVGVFHLTC
jgi:hypothetical protein